MFKVRFVKYIVFTAMVFFVLLGMQISFEKMNDASSRANTIGKSLPHSEIDQLKNDEQFSTSSLAKKAALHVPSLIHTSQNFTIGDSVKITFYETLGNESDAEKSLHWVEQTRVSGTYLVQQNGYITIPFLGAFEIIRLSNEQLAEKLEQKYTAVFQQTPRISLSITEQQPIYVIGNNAEAGTLKYQAGMTVLHALATIGNNQKREANVYLLSELSRQTERNHNARRHLKQAVARTIVLKAERDGKSPKPSNELILLTKKEEANLLIKKEIRDREFIKKMQSLKLDSLRSLLANNQHEIGELNANLKNFKSYISHHKTLKNKMNKLHKQRLVKNSIKNRAVIDAFNVEERVVQLKISLVQAKQKQVNIKNQLSSLILQQQIDLEKEIVDTEKRIEQEESMLAASQTLMNTLNKKVAHGYLADQNAEQFKIIRQTTQGPRLIKANEMTQLNAGDLVYIRSSQPMN